MIPTYDMCLQKLLRKTESRPFFGTALSQLEPVNVENDIPTIFEAILNRLEQIGTQEEGKYSRCNAVCLLLFSMNNKVLTF